MKKKHIFFLEQLNADALFLLSNKLTLLRGDWVLHLD